MKQSARYFAVLLIVCVGLPLFANAASWFPFSEEHDEKAVKGTMVKGTVICLFQSGTADVRKEINVHDILFVYRENPPHELKAVGKIKVLSYIGEDYLKGEVIEGELKAGDIAKKGAVASLIISEINSCK